MLLCAAKVENNPTLRTEVFSQLITVCLLDYSSKSLSTKPLNFRSHKYGYAHSQNNELRIPLALSLRGKPQCFQLQNATSQVSFKACEESTLPPSRQSLPLCKSNRGFFISCIPVNGLLT